MTTINRLTFLIAPALPASLVGVLVYAFTVGKLDYAGLIAGFVFAVCYTVTLVMWAVFSVSASVDRRME